MAIWRLLFFMSIVYSAASDECVDQLGLYLGYFADIATMPLWAVVMFDATTKIPEGILAGKLYNTGNFDECINLRNIQTQYGKFDGKYCLVTAAPNLSFLPKNDNSFRELQSVHTDFILEHFQKRSGMETSSLGLVLSVCVPSICSASHIQEFLPSLWEGLLNVNISIFALDDYCQTAERSLQTTDWLVVMFLVVFGTIVIVGTIHDLGEKDPGKRVNILLSFSLYTNGKRLFNTSASTEYLGYLHGIRFITITWVVLAHFYSQALGNMSNTVYFTEDNKYSWTRLYLTNATFSVDTFLLLSGLLVSYVFLKTVLSAKNFNLLIFYIHRYVRLTPALAVVVLLVATVVKYSTTGPLWDVAFSGIADKCVRNWWSTLLYVNNYVHPQDMCVGTAWYLAVDMQLYWLSPLLLIPLWTKPRFGLYFGLILGIIGMVIPFVITYTKELGGSMYTLQGQAAENYFKYYYATAYCRFTPYVIGILLGYYLLRLKSLNQNITLTKLQTLAAWLCVAAFLVVPLMSVYPMHQSNYKYNVLDASFYNALARPSWSLGVALLICLCNFGYGGIINKILSWSFFIPLSKLTYGTYLTHSFIHVIQIYSARSSMFGGEIFLIPGYLGSLILSIFAALILYLWFESPFMVLEKELLRNKKSVSSGKSD